MIAKWLAYNKVTETNEYITLPLLDKIQLNYDVASFKVSTITIIYDDFLDYQLPFAWQEILLVDDLDVTKYIFYFKSMTAPVFETGNEVIKLKFSLYTTRDLIAHRNLTLSESTSLHNAISSIVGDVLISDGYTIAENDLVYTNISISYIKQSIESILNDLANTYNFIWYCDEFKQFYFKQVVELVNKDTDILIDNTNNINYGWNVQPKLSTLDYVNIVELKNIISIEEDIPFDYIYDQFIGAGTYTLKSSFWLDEIAWYKVHPGSTTGNIISIYINSDFANGYFIYWNGTEFIVDADIGIFDADYSPSSATNLISFFRDQDNPQIISSFKYNGTTTDEVQIRSTVTLKPKSLTYYDVDEIEKISVFTNTSGKIERTLNMYNQYLGQDETLAIAKGALVSSNQTTSEVSLVLEVSDKSIAYPNITLGQVIEIDLSGNVGKLVGNNSFVITSYKKTETITRVRFEITAKNVNLNTTFIDLYRKINIQETTEQLTNEIAIYVRGEDVVEKVEVLVDGGIVNES